MALNDSTADGYEHCVQVLGHCGTDENFEGCSVFRLPDGTAMALEQHWAPNQSHVGLAVPQWPD